MTHGATLQFIVIIMCASYVRSLNDNTTYDTLNENVGIKHHLTTETTTNQTESFNATRKNIVSVPIVVNNNTETHYLQFRDGDVNNGYHTGNKSMKIINSTLKFANNSEPIGNVTYYNNDIDQEYSNITYNNEDKESVHGDISLVIRTDPKNVLLHEQQKTSHSTKVDDTKRLKLEERKVMLQHHLQLVPMEDKPLDSMILKSHRYLISVLVPIGVGMIGAVMIACTVVTLRRVARTRPAHTPLDDDAEPERSIASHISSISTDTTDKVFLLQTDEI